jgi:hypothetical protein
MLGSQVEKETQSLAWKNYPNVEEKKNHGKTDVLYVVQVQGTRGSIYIGKGDRDRVT